MAPETGLEADPLLEGLWSRGLVLFGEDVWKEYALRTPIFIDLRHKLYDDLELLMALGRAIHRKIGELVPAGGRAAQQVIGIPDTATPLALAAALASQGTRLPLLYGQLRKRPARYPGGEWGVSCYMGIRDPAREITLIDDVMASGNTKLWARKELAKDGLDVRRIVVVVDREQGGDKILAEEGCPVHHLYTISDLVRYYERQGKIGAGMAGQALEHIRSRRFRPQAAG